MKPKILAFIITGGAFLVAASHIVWPDANIDGITLGLLVVALLPWLRPILKSIELPGGLKFELQDYEQSTTEHPPAPPQEQLAARQSQPHVVDDTARMKVLATLWQYQRQFFKNDYTKRWTFAVGPAAPDYPFYLRGVAALVSEGLGTVSPENNHVLLTNEGINYCEQHPNDLNDTDIYRF